MKIYEMDILSTALLYLRKIIGLNTGVWMKKNYNI